MTDRLLLLDAPSLYFRAYFGVPDSIRAPDGTPVNAIRGFLDMLARLITTTQSTRVVAAMDADWRPAFRVSAIPSYKLHRVAGEDPTVETVPDTLSPQVPVIEAVLEALGIACFGVEGYEADDVIGTLATDPGCPTDVVTGDRDLFQLVDDSVPVRILYTAKGVGKSDPVTEAVVAEKYGIPGRAYADFAVLRGDPSDGLPGVAGVGDKTAAALITRFGSLEALLAALDAGDEAGFPAGARMKLLTARDYLEVAPAVVAVVRDVPLPAYDDRLPQAPRSPDVLVELCDRWGLDSSVNRVLAAMAATP